MVRCLCRQALLAAQQAEHLEARLRAELVAAESSHAGIDVEAASPEHSSVEGTCGMGLAADLQAELAARSCELAAARVREESLRSELQQAASDLVFGEVLRVYARDMSVCLPRAWMCDETSGFID